MGKKPLCWVIKQIRYRIPAILILTLANMGSTLLGVFFALGSRRVIDSAVSGDMKEFGRSCVIQGGIILGIFLCMTLARHLRDRLIADLDRDWKKKLLHGLLNGDFLAVSAYHSGELLNRLNNDVARVDGGILTIVPGGAAMITRLTSAVIILGILDFRFMLLMGALGSLVIGGTAVMRRWLKALNKRVSECEGRVFGYLQEVLEKLLMVQALDVSTEVEHRADRLLEERYELQRKRKNVSLLTSTGVTILSYGSSFFALIWCAWRMFQGQMSFGSLTAVIQLVSQLQSPFVNLSGVLSQYAAMTASAERLMELDAIQRLPAANEADREALYRRLDCITAEGLCFAYDRDQILTDASFCLPKGSFLAVTGPSGIGKSTLLKLMLGIFEPDSGALHICSGREKIPLDRSTRNLFAYVPQGNLLLSGTLRENLTLVAPAATEQQIQQAVYTSAMDEFLPQMPQGLDTVLGENGAGLSEGQAQRLAIARAVLGGAPILLLDECTSALDEETEQKVLRRLKALPDRMCIAVTHSPGAAVLFDWHLEVENGRIRSSRAEK